MGKILCQIGMIIAASCLMAGCGSKPLQIKTEYQPVYINVPSPCPEKATGDILIASRPYPLRNTPRPSDASVRSAQSQAQLGKYEAEGGWADKVVAALQSCQQK